MTVKCNTIMDSNWTNQLKGIAIIFVMLGHLLMLNFAGAWGVSIFLVVSGYGLTQSYKVNGFKKFIRKRISKFWFPYFLVTCLWLIVNLLKYDITYTKKHVIFSLLGLNFKDLFDLSMWYVTFLLSWYIIYYLTFLIIKNNYARLILLFAFSLFWYKYGLQILPSPVGAARYAFCFPVGVLLSLCSEKIIKNNYNKSISFFGSLSILTFIMFMYKYIRTVTLLDQTIQCLLIGVCVVSVFIVFSFASFRCKPLEYIGIISYEIYLFEYVFIENYKFIFELPIKNSWIRIGIYFAFVFILAFVFNKILNIKKILKAIKTKSAIKGI